MGLSRVTFVQHGQGHGQRGNVLKEVTGGWVIHLRSIDLHRDHITALHLCPTLVERPEEPISRREKMGQG